MLMLANIDTILLFFSFLLCLERVGLHASHYLAKFNLSADRCSNVYILLTYTRGFFYGQIGTQQLKHGHGRKKALMSIERLWKIQNLKIPGKKGGNQKKSKIIRVYITLINFLARPSFHQWPVCISQHSWHVKTSPL